MNKTKQQIDEFLKKNPGSSYVVGQHSVEPTPSQQAEVDAMKEQQKKAEQQRSECLRLSGYLQDRAMRNQPSDMFDYSYLVNNNQPSTMLIAEIGGKQRALRILKQVPVKPDFSLKEFKALDLDTAQTEHKLKGNFKELENLKSAGYYYEAEKKQRIIDQRKKRITFNNSRKAKIEEETIFQSKDFIEKQNELIKFLQEQIKKTESGIKEVEQFLKVYDTPEKEKERLNLRMAFSNK